VQDVAPQRQVEVVGWVVREPERLQGGEVVDCCWDRGNDGWWAAEVGGL
jgi:hypothetical protein